MREVPAEAGVLPGPAREPAALQPNEIRAIPRSPSLVTLAAIAAAPTEAAWIAGVLDALQSCDLHAPHVLVDRGSGLRLAGGRGLPPELEEALERGDTAAGLPLAGEMLAAGLVRVGWIEDRPAALDLAPLLAVAGGAFARLRAAHARDELWLAAAAIDVEIGGSALLEAIAAQARRLSWGTHAEIRFKTATGEEVSACSLLGGAPDRSCCAAAAREAMRLPLRHGQAQLAELLIAGGPDSGIALRLLRKFTALAAARLEIERLRQEVAMHAHAQVRTRGREERFELALANAPIFLGTQDRELRYSWIYPAPSGREEDVLGRTDLDLFSPGEALRLQALKERVLASGQHTQAEVSVTLAGQLRTFQLVLDPIRDPWGETTGIAFAAIDVTTRAREAGVREQLLLKREDERSWLLTVIERSPVGILLFETDGGEERVTANRRAAELLGHAVDPRRARRVVAGRLSRADGTPVPFEQLPSSRAMRGERVTMEEALLRRLDGSRIPIVISAGPILDAAGRHAGAIVTFDDISPFKEIERMREQWTSLITHDLRQPITSISGFASVLADHPDLPAHLRSKVVHIVAAAKRLGRMTADLLEASRLESNQLALERQPTDLAVLVGEVVERLAGELQDHPVEVEQHDPLPVLSIDPERFEQVLGNLLSNAAKYSPPGAAIRLDLQRHDDEAIVGITNEGAGLTAEELGTIFRRFQRTDAARRSRIRGLGLGLYIARGLVEAHGGRIWAETEPGRSVTFRVALPLGSA